MITPDSMTFDLLNDPAIHMGMLHVITWSNGVKRATLVTSTLGCISYPDGVGRCLLVIG